jgi:hypothetical protein
VVVVVVAAAVASLVPILLAKGTRAKQPAAVLLSAVLLCQVRLPTKKLRFLTMVTKGKNIQASPALVELRILLLLTVKMQSLYRRLAKRPLLCASGGADIATEKKRVSPQRNGSLTYLCPWRLLPPLAVQASVGMQKERVKKVVVARIIAVSQLKSISLANGVVRATEKAVGSGIPNRCFWCIAFLFRLDLKI